MAALEPTRGEAEAVRGLVAYIIDFVRGNPGGYHEFAKQATRAGGEKGVVVIRARSVSHLASMIDRATDSVAFTVGFVQARDWHTSVTYDDARTRVDSHDAEREFCLGVCVRGRKMTHVTLAVVSCAASRTASRYVVNDEPLKAVCAVCGVGSSRVCAACGATHYCSKEHQVEDHPNHKAHCRQLKVLAQMQALPAGSKKRDVCAVCSAACSKTCAGCRLVGYCGAEHQRRHWPAHKKECGRHFWPAGGQI